MLCSWWAFYSLGQSVDCWIFLKKAVLVNELSIAEGDVQGYSPWFHALAVSNLDANCWTEHILVDSLLCYPSVQLGYELAADTLDTNQVSVPKLAFDSIGVISETLFSDSSLFIPNEEDWEVIEEVQVKYEQLEMMQGYDFIQEGYTGEGVVIAVLDAGFSGLKNDSAFQHLLSSNAILKSYDFVKKDNDVFHSSNHGTHVMSCLAGLYQEQNTGDPQPLGLATCSKFLLARAEQSFSGRLVKEVNFINALEWAVENGADIITSSLIFGEQLYTRQQMNGSSLISKAAEMAFQKNVLVLNSAGNSDQNHWEILGAPGDAEHVLAIGACDWNGLKSSFSSVGPTSDWRAKPDLIARGNVFVSSNNHFSSESGTSFSCPLVAGFAACVMQMHPDWTAAKIRQELLQSATLYPYHDYAHGYGIPQAGYFLFPSELPSLDSATFHFEVMSDQVVEVVIHSKVLIDIDQEENEQLEDLSGDNQADESQLLYVECLDSLGRIVEYWTVIPDGERGGLYDISGVPGGALRVFYKKYIQQMDFR